MTEELFIKKVPSVVKELIGLEAARNHRSLNQEALALLEEALLQRVRNSDTRRDSALATLSRYAAEAGGAPGATMTAVAPHATSPAATRGAADAATSMP
jgi:plasmid stability protein